VLTALPSHPPSAVAPRACRSSPALAGRAAEQVVFGRVTNGAASDLEKVTLLAPAMVVSDDATYPILGALYHPPGGIIRHDAVVWGVNDDGVVWGMGDDGVVWGMGDDGVVWGMNCAGESCDGVVWDGRR